MRDRQRKDRSETPIKAALTDIQYIAEAGVLCCAADQPELIDRREPQTQLRWLGNSGWLANSLAEPLCEAWSALIRARHLSWLQRQTAKEDLRHWQAPVAKAWKSVFGDKA